MTTCLRSMFVLGLLGALACSKKTPEPTSQAPKAAEQAKPAASEATASAGGDGKLDPNDPKHGTRKLMGLDVAVFVDGVQAGVLRYGELPIIEAIELEGGAKRYRLYDYLKAIGIAPESIKSVHLHGNADRIGSVEGSELVKGKNRFIFGFSSGDTGAPQQKWEVTGLKNAFNAHEIRRVSVFVKKPVAPIDPAKHCHVGPDGDCMDGTPYVDKQAVAKGTRVYLDGKMVGFVKRRQVGEQLAVGDTAEGEHKYSVAKLVAQMGVDPASVKSVELMAGDDVISRATGEQFQSLASNTYFTLPQHQHGKVRVHVPADIQAKDSSASDRDALVSAVLLFKNSKPLNRDLVAISEDTDLSVQLAAIDDAHAKLGRGEQ